MMIALSGLAGTGKTTAIELLEREGFGNRVYVGGFVTDHVAALGMPAGPVSEKRVRKQLRDEHGAAGLATLAMPQIVELLDANKTPLIDAIYSVAEREFYERTLSSRLHCISITTKLAVRISRLAARDVRPMNAQDLAQRDEYELNVLGLTDVLGIADHHIMNDGSLGELGSCLEEVLADIT